MMRIILLLLVTLTGPFCTFTQASTLVAPTTVVSALGANTVSDASADTTVETVPQDAVSTSQPASGATEVSALTEVPMVSTAATVTVSEDKLKTASPTDTIQATEAGPEETTDAKATTVAESRVEGTAVTGNAESDHTDKDEAMGTGQVVGIVIGALIAVIVVIAVIILVVRRMGQYSTAKKRKPRKQESILISPLKRKARQEEKKKKSGKF